MRSRSRRISFFGSQESYLDSRKVEITDLGANFCLEKEDVGKRSRAAAS